MSAVVAVPELVTRAARQHPQRPALVEPGGRTLTWEQLESEVDRVAAALSGRGVVAGYRVAIVLDNRIELVLAYLGALRAQAVAVPLNPRGTAAETARELADARARVVVTGGPGAGVVREAVAALDDPPVVVVAGEAPRSGEVSLEESAPTGGTPPPPARDPEALAALLYTSGTSGRPRAAMLTHRALLANLAQVAAVDPPLVAEDDVVLGVVPLFHVYGLNAVLGGVLHAGATLVLLERSDPEEVLDVVAGQGCTVVPVAPPAIVRWAGADRLAERLRGVRTVVSGSAPLPDVVVREFAEHAGVGVHQGYGLTEAAPVVTSTLAGTSGRPGSVGAALPGVEVRLADAAGDRPDPGDAGEIRVRGDNLFNGYWPDASDGPDADGWWSTGDVGFLDEEGDLFLVDRVKELVIVSGFNVYPVEVEEVLTAIPGVREAAVIGVPDDETGEAVVAYLVAPDVPAADVREEAERRCAEQLARFKRPARLEVVDVLPHTVTGKVQKGWLRGTERHDPETPDP